MATYRINLAPANMGTLDLTNFQASTLLQDNEGKSRIYKHGDEVTVTNDTAYGRFFIDNYVAMGIAVLVS